MDGGFCILKFFPRRGKDFVMGLVLWNGWCYKNWMGVPEISASLEFNIADRSKNKRVYSNV
jgi:hypothetical protein